MGQISSKLTGCHLHSVHRDTMCGKLKFRANLTKDFVKKMQWSDLGAGQVDAGMQGVIQDATLIMSADQENLFANGEFRADVQSVGKFQVVRLELKDKRGKGFRFVLDFEARFVQEGIAALAEAWIMKSGAGTGLLKIDGVLAEAADPETGEEGE